MKRNSLKKELAEAHNKWVLSTNKKEKFNYTYLRNSHRALCSAIEKKYSTISQAYEDAGINPDCHSGQYKYGNRKGDSSRNSKDTFKLVLNEIKDNLGTSILNDSSMNQPVKIDVPKALKLGTLNYYSVCEKSNCEINEIKLQSIYAAGRRYYGDWKNAVESVGLNYEKDVLRKVAARDWIKYIEMFANFIEAKNHNFKISDLKNNKKNYPIYSGLTKNYREKSPLSPFQSDLMLGSYIEANAFIDGDYDNLEKYYKVNFERLKDKFNNENLAQNVWSINNRVKGKTSGGSNKIQQELILRYASGRRITRNELENSGIKSDKTLVSAMRRKTQRKNYDFVDSLKSSGFLNDQLQKLYIELDDPFSLEYLHKTFIRLLKESLQNNENRLTREYCSDNEVEFHNAIIRKFKSWEAGQRKFGIDPKVFSISASKRTKRGRIFELFFDGMLKRYGFNSLSKVINVKNDNDYTFNKTISNCNHLKNGCKPDFFFKNFIIDVKTGYSARQQKNQLNRYLEHNSLVYVITLKGKLKEESRKYGKVIFISFEDFIKNSYKILNIQMNEDEPQNLTKELKTVPFWE